MLEKTLESPLDCKEIKPVHPKGNQPWIFIGRTDAKAEAPILWPPDAKSRLIRKDPDAGQDWGRRRRGWQRTRWLDATTNTMDMSLSKLQEMVIDREALCVVVNRVAKSWTWLRSWTIQPRTYQEKLKSTSVLCSLVWLLPSTGSHIVLSCQLLSLGAGNHSSPLPLNCIHLLLIVLSPCSLLCK